jgi:FixJ family two-component response regulator
VGLSDSLKAQGADGFLTKPFGKQKLLEAIKDMVAN